jgi:hypothetical protein
MDITVHPCHRPAGCGTGAHGDQLTRGEWKRLPGERSSPRRSPCSATPGVGFTAGQRGALLTPAAHLLHVLARGQTLPRRLGEDKWAGLEQGGDLVIGQDRDGLLRRRGSSMPSVGATSSSPSATSHRQNRRIARSRVATVEGSAVSANSASHAQIACQVS